MLLTDQSCNLILHSELTNVSAPLYVHFLEASDEWKVCKYCTLDAVSSHCVHVHLYSHSPWGVVQGPSDALDGVIGVSPGPPVQRGQVEQNP